MQPIQIVVDQPTPSYFCCPICLTEETSSDQDTQPRILQECNHAFCRMCLKEHIETQINSLNVLKIKCPQDGCNKFITAQAIQAILDQKSFERYQRLVEQKLNKRNKGTNICPKPGCSEPYTVVKDSYYTKCSCESLICNLCGDFWHEGKNCLEIIDPEFEKYVQENQLKFCTMCKTVVARVEGCTHITCPVCDYEWCWLCGREYSDSHDWRCPKVWSPVPPKRIRHDSNNETCLTKIPKYLKKIIIFLILLPLRLLFWPLWMLNVFAEMRSPNRERGEKIQILIVALITTLIHDGLVFMMLFFTFAGYGLVASFILGLTCLVMLLIPWTFKLVIEVRDFLAQRSSAREGSTKRWLTRNAETFKYTSSHRPTLDNNNNRNFHEALYFQRPIAQSQKVERIPANKITPVSSQLMQNPSFVIVRP